MAFRVKVDRWVFGKIGFDDGIRVKWIWRLSGQSRQFGRWVD